MSWVKKPWGQKQTIFESNDVIVDHLQILPGGFSSIHFHKLLRNTFYVLPQGDYVERTERLLTIQIFELQDGKPNPADHMVISHTDGPLTIPPKVIHRFQNASSLLLDIIEVSYLHGITIDEDIYRIPGFEKGGVQ